MYPAYLRITKTLLALSLASFATSAAPRLHAQAQSLLSSNQVVVSRVENVTANTILISGINFDKFKGSPVVSLSGSGSAVSTLSSTYNASSKDIVAVLPVSVASLPGTYRLMVSFGSGTAGTDVFEFTVGAVGPQGVKGDKGEQGAVGPQGIKGDKGDTGAQGVQGIQGEKGEKGDRGEQGIQGPKGETGVQGTTGAKGDRGDPGARGEIGPQGPAGATGPAGVNGNLPLFQNVTEAREAGIQIGQLWVHESSGQVFQMVK